MRDPAGAFAKALVRHHQADLASGNETIRDVVIIKMVALITLAFERPAVTGQPLNIEEALRSLESAVRALERIRKAAKAADG